MAKTITRMDNENVAIVEDFQKRNVFLKTDLEKQKVALQQRISDIDELLAAFTV